MNIFRISLIVTIPFIYTYNYIFVHKLFEFLFVKYFLFRRISVIKLLLYNKSIGSRKINHATRRVSPSIGVDYWNIMNHYIIIHACNNTCLQKSEFGFLAASSCFLETIAVSWPAKLFIAISLENPSLYIASWALAVVWVLAPHYCIYIYIYIIYCCI